MKTEDLIFYQIYPKSFCDSDGDGVGDLAGILSKVEYLKTLGVNAVWLTPCFRSPGVDNGYDISDYRAIDGRMGTLAQMEGLIESFHKKGIAVILDLVANHTSTEHEWFQRSKAGDGKYRDYYIWRKCPNEWQSVFGGPAWEYDERTGEYYLHSFAVEQADLNWENPAVRKEMRDVVEFWLNKGVDGFRCDVLDMISKDWARGVNGNGPHLHEYIRELFGGERAQELFTVGECWSADTENVGLFCGKDRKELTTVFAFDHLCMDEGRFRMGRPPLKTLCKRISDWQLATQTAGLTPTVFLGNHDQPRAVSRFGDDKRYRYESATLLGGLTLLHRGVPFLFQGEELGLTNSDISSAEEIDDVESLRYYRANLGKLPKEELLARINFGGRDNARYLLPWDGKTHESWIAPYARRTEINAEADMRSDKSVFDFYRSLIALRKAEPCLTKGEYVCEEIGDDQYIFSRRYGGETVTAVCNFEREAPFGGREGRVLLTNYPEVGKTLKPYQLVVYKSL